MDDCSPCSWGCDASWHEGHLGGVCVDVTVSSGEQSSEFIIHEDHIAMSHLMWWRPCLHRAYWSWVLSLSSLKWNRAHLSADYVFYDDFYRCVVWCKPAFNRTRRFQLWHWNLHCEVTWPLLVLLSLTCRLYSADACQEGQDNSAWHLPDG